MPQAVGIARCAIGELVQVARGAVPTGASEVQILVRPEKIRVSRERRSDRDFEAEVIDQLYAGATTLLRLRTRSGLGVTALLVAGEAAPAPRQVFCGIRGEDVTILG